MTKYAAIAALTLALHPVVALASTIVVPVTPLPPQADPIDAQVINVSPGNYMYAGAVVADNLNPIFAEIGSQPPFGFASSSYANTPFMYNLHTYISAVAQPILYPAPPPPSLPILGFTISCVPYSNANLGISGYPYSIDLTNGLTGGTVSIEEVFASPPALTPQSFTFVFPNSPHGGPYVNTYTANLSAPYYPTPGSTITAWVSSITNPSYQGYTGCLLTAVI